jgi:4'-phosphopantetheinyl transferase EntD
VLERIAVAQERAWLPELAAAVPGLSWDRLLFCAKESVYKAWFGATGRHLAFAGVRVELAEAGRFAAHVDSTAARIDGRWLVRDGLALTAVTVPV